MNILSGDQRLSSSNYLVEPTVNDWIANNIPSMRPRTVNQWVDPSLLANLVNLMGGYTNHKQNTHCVHFINHECFSYVFTGLYIKRLVHIFSNCSLVWTHTLVCFITVFSINGFSSPASTQCHSYGHKNHN